MKFENIKMNNELFSDQFSVLYQTRYCAQEDVRLALCMDGNIRLLEKPFCLRNLHTSEIISCLPGQSSNSHSVACGSDLYLVCENDKSYTLGKFSFSNKKLKELPPLLDERIWFSVSCFMQKLFVISGSKINEDKLYKSCSSCMCYDSKSDEWT